MPNALRITHVPAYFRRRAARIALATISAIALSACDPAVAPAIAAPTLPSVPVVRVELHEVKPAISQIGRVEAAQRVEIRPRVAGHIEAVLFKEGDVVSAGQPLFRIDSRPFDATVARAEAELKLAQAREGLARTEAQRARQLAGDLAISAEELERRLAAHEEARARIAAAQATLQAASLDRDFALIRSPIAGRIGRALVTAGNFVGAGAAQAPLASIVSVAPLHVHFDVADRRVVEQVGVQRVAGAWVARVLDADGQRELAQAPVDFADNEVVASTGTLRLRARIDAPPRHLIPGQYVRVQLATGERQPVLLVPDKAIGTDQGRRFVLVVPADGKVEYRPVEVGSAHGEHRIVTAGLKAGEQVVVSGLMRVRPGMAVQARPAEEAPAQARAGKPAQS